MQACRSSEQLCKISSFSKNGANVRTAFAIGIEHQKSVERLQRRPVAPADEEENWWTCAHLSTESIAYAVSSSELLWWSLCLAPSLCGGFFLLWGSCSSYAVRSFLLSRTGRRLA